MKVKDKTTGEERNCCDPRQDFVVANAEEFKNKIHKNKVFKCVHCGQKWKYGHDGMCNVWKEMTDKK